MRLRTDWNENEGRFLESIAPSIVIARDLPNPAQRNLSFIVPSRRALVLGSAQSESLVDKSAIGRRDHDVVEVAVHESDDVEVVRRRTGGGAVFLVPDHCLWVDIVIPRNDALWEDDVSRSFLWLGNTWQRALRQCGFDAQVNPGPRERNVWSELVCFASLGAGEVTIDRKKVVGMSQRRTRDAAKFQCVLYNGRAVHREAIEFVDLLTQPTDTHERVALREHLERSVASVPASASDLIASFVDSLPRPS